MNLPGNADYDLSGPWVYKQHHYGHIACEILSYVDDQQITAPT